MVTESRDEEVLAAVAELFALCEAQAARLLDAACATLRRGDSAEGRQSGTSRYTTMRSPPLSSA